MFKYHYLPSLEIKRMSFNKFQIKEHFLKFTPRYTISDEHGYLIATVNKHPFSLSKKATYLDENGLEKLTIHKKKFSFRRTYFIHKNDQIICRIWKTFGFRPEIFVESLVEPDAFVIEGNILRSEYSFFKNDTEFAHVSRNIWKIPDQYGVAIKKDEDQDIVLAMVIIIDLIQESRRRRS